MSTHDGSSPRIAWMISLADLLGIMLAFFVLSFAMRGVDEKHWHNLKHSVNETFVTSPNSRNDAVRTIRPPQHALRHRIVEPEYLKQVIDGQIQQDKVLEGVRTSISGRNISIRIPIEMVFETDTKELSNNGILLLYYIGTIIDTLNNKVECHVVVPGGQISDVHFLHFWELSLQRATAIADELKKSGYRYNIPVFGRVAQDEDVSGQASSAIEIMIYPTKA